MEEKYERASNCIKALAHPIRLKIIEALRKGEKSVSEIEDFCGNCSQSNISQHLSLMKLKGIIKSSKKGNHVFYSISKKDIYKALDLLAGLFCKV